MTVAGQLNNHWLLASRADDVYDTSSISHLYTHLSYRQLSSAATSDFTLVEMQYSESKRKSLGIAMRIAQH